MYIFMSVYPGVYSRGEWNGEWSPEPSSLVALYPMMLSLMPNLKGEDEGGWTYRRCEMASRSVC